MDLSDVELKDLVIIYIPYLISEAIKWIASRTFLENEQFKLLHAISESQQRVSESQERVASAFKEVANVLSKILQSVTIVREDSDLEDEEIN
jgi:hypothetical protein